MGKRSRRAVSQGSSGGVAVLEPGTPVPVVGMREPCPCGSGKRYKACHGKAARDDVPQLVTRPFEGLPGECDWVALREIVPSATATVTTTPEYGAVDVTVATVLPMAWPGLHRADGTILVGLQTTSGSGDASRDAAHALLAARAAEPGTPVLTADVGVTGPRLQDVLDLAAPFEVTLHEGFDFWLGADTEQTPQVRESMARANDAVVPTRRLASVEAGYWCAIGERRHLRWVVPFSEDAFLDGLARLHAAGSSALIEGSRYVGAFRADGLVVPVWDLPPGTEADAIEEPAAAFASRLDEAMASDAPLTAVERGARAGVVSRQLTLR